MAEPQPSTSSPSSNIRHRDNNDDEVDDANIGEPSRKYQKLDNDDAAADDDDGDAPYYDVLERIFEFLDMESFLNLANTCKRLQIAAAAKFHDDFRKKKIVLEFSEYGRISYIEELHREIRVVGLSYCLPFLRCFGANCSHLTVSGLRSTPPIHNDRLDQYINRYCADTLTSIRYVEKPSFKLENSPKPFKCVQDVYIGHLDLGQSLPVIAELFPNLNHLVMYFISIDENFTAVPFPQLKDLAINEYKNLTINGLTKLLHANRQLEAFQLQVFNTNGRMTLTQLSNMIAENPDITKFWVSSRHQVIVNTNELWRFANERPAMASLDLSRFIIEVDDAILYVRQMQSLKMFVFKLKENNEYDRLVNQLSNEWKHRIIFVEDNPNYSLNNVVTLNR